MDLSCAVLFNVPSQEKRAEMTWKDFYEGLRGKKEFALFAWDDPMPFIRSAWSHLKNAWKQKRKE